MVLGARGRGVGQKARCLLTFEGQMFGVAGIVLEARVDHGVVAKQPDLLADPPLPAVCVADGDESRFSVSTVKWGYLCLGAPAAREAL